MEYKDTNDSEILYMINEDNETAYEYLYEKYKNIVYKIASKYSYHASKLGLDINDLILEGYVGFDQAIKSYNENNKTNNKFSGFLYMCIERKIQTLIRTKSCNKNKILNEAAYLEDQLEQLNIKDETIKTPEEETIENYELNMIYNKIKNNLKGIELSVFKLKIEGYTNKEISKILNKDLKSIRNAIQRIRKNHKFININ